MNTVSENLVEKGVDINTIPGITELWAETKGDKKICIAVIDTGIDEEHPCFKGAQINTVKLFNTGNNGSNENNIAEHGTSVASIIFGQHHSAIKGLAPGCKGIVIPVFRSREGDGDSISCSQLDLARAIQTADQHGANIINISGGEFSSSGKSEVILAETIQKCIKKGILIISAAGNDGCECLHVPAADNSVLAVGALDENNKPLDFSNWGKSYQSNGLLFPGNNIRVAVPGNQTALKKGTSFATAIASGIAGLLMSLLVKKGQKPDGRLIFDALINSAFKCVETGSDDCTKALAGHVNVAGALKKLTGSLNFLNDDHFNTLSSAVKISEQKEAITEKSHFHESSIPGVAASYITTKKKTRLWNQLTKLNLQLI